MDGRETRARWSFFNLSEFSQLAKSAPRFLKSNFGYTDDEVKGLKAVERACAELGLALPEDLYHQALRHILSGKKYSETEKRWAADELRRRWHYTQERISQIRSAK